MNEINLYQYIKSATIWSKNEVQMPVEEIIAMQHQIINLNYSKLLGEIIWDLIQGQILEFFKGGGSIVNIGFQTGGSTLKICYF